IGQSLGDFYAEVSINGTTLNNFAKRCDNPPATPPANMVFDVPYVFFAEGDPLVDPSYPDVPEAWTFTVDFPASTLLATPRASPSQSASRTATEDRSTTTTIRPPSISRSRSVVAGRETRAGRTTAIARPWREAARASAGGSRSARTRTATACSTTGRSTASTSTVSTWIFPAWGPTPSTRISS